MKKQRIELMPQVYLTVLETDRFRTNCLSLNILRPLRQEEAALGALLPDVLLRGCRMCPDMGKISAWLDERYGAGAQAVVRKKGEIQSIGFFLDYIDEKFVEPGARLTEDICRLLGSFLLEPVTENGVFRQDYVDGEKVNLINAILAQINDKRTYASNRLRQEMFPNEPYGVSKNGERAEAEAITPEALYRYYRHILAHSRIELVFAGRTDPDQLAGYLRDALKDLPREQTDPVVTETGPMPETVREITEDMDITQGNLVMGFRSGITAKDPEYPAFVVFNAVYGGGVTSKLFRRVREELSLCYYASSGTDRFKGIMLVSSGVDSDNYTRARDEILRQLDLCRDGDFTEEELHFAKSALRSNLRSSEDSLMAMEDFCLGQEIGGFTYTPEALSEAIAAVTPEDVRAVARRIRLDTIFFLKGAAHEETDL